MSDDVDLTATPAYIHPELETAVDELAEAFAGIYSRETVATVVVDSYTPLARTARIPVYLPLSHTGSPVTGCAPTRSWRDT